MTLSAERIGVRLGGCAVLDDVSFALAPGTLVGVLGPNGAGKSTLVRALLGLQPAAGTVRLDGTPRASLPRDAAARAMAYLPQGQTVHWPVSVERLVALGRLPHLAPMSRMGEGDRAAVARAMRLAAVDHLAARPATELSGGERARVLLARALAAEARVLLADEPLAGLDPEHQLQGLEVLRAQARGGALVVAVLHDLDLAHRFCDRVLVLRAGRLVADGAPAAVLTPALLADVYRVRAIVDETGIRVVERLR